MKVWQCNTDWPVCIYDFTIKSKNPSYLAYRVKPLLTTLCIQEYFYAGGAHQHNYSREA